MDLSEMAVTKRGLEGSARLRLAGIRQLQGSACEQKTPMPAPKNPNAATTKTPMPARENPIACTPDVAAAQCLRTRVSETRVRRHWAAAVLRRR